MSSNAANHPCYAFAAALRLLHLRRRASGYDREEQRAMQGLNSIANDGRGTGLALELVETTMLNAFPGQKLLSSGRL